MARLSHTDEIVIFDVCLFILEDVGSKGLILKEGIPSFITPLDYSLENIVVEKAIIVREMEEVSPALYKEIREKLTDKIRIKKISHEKLKKRLSKAKAIVRTGEFTSYVNIILKKRGVNF